MNPNDYPVYPEDDGFDKPRNPYSPVQNTPTLGPCGPAAGQNSDSLPQILK